MSSKRGVRWGAALLIVTVASGCGHAAKPRSSPRPPSPSAIASSPAASESASVGFVPDTLQIPSLDIAARVTPKGTETVWDPVQHVKVTQFGVPTDAASTTWWSDGPKPGEDGVAIILGHSARSGNGVFNHLADVAPGADVTVAGESRTLTYRVLSVVPHIPDADVDALDRVLEKPPPGASLALVTCGGLTKGTWTENTVVFAAPAPSS